MTKNSKLNRVRFGGVGRKKKRGKGDDRKRSSYWKNEKSK